MKNKYLFLGLSTCLLFASCVKKPATDDEPINKGLLAHYPFNGNANDISGNGYNLLVKGAVPIDNRFGEVNKAYKFNGTSDVMVIPKIAKADSLREFTISAWVYAEAENQYQSSIISFAGKDPHLCSYNVGFYIVPPVYLDWHEMITEVDPFNCTWTVIRDTIDNPFNKWVHIVFVQSYDKSNPFYSMYKYNHYYNNKKLKFSGSDFDPVVTSFNAGGVVGANNVSRDINIGNFLYFKGVIDDIRIYNRALSDAEVAQLYNLRE